MADEVSPAPKRRRSTKKVVEVEVEVFDPSYEAHKLRLSGMAWEDVAKETGYPSVDACRMGVQRLLTRAAAQLNKEQQAERLSVELDRLDALQYAFWGAAVHGDEKAAMFCLNVSKQRGKLLGLEAQEKETVTTKTIVVAGSQEDYVNSLREVIESQAD